MTLTERIKDFQLVAGQIGVVESLRMKTALLLARVRQAHSSVGNNKRSSPVCLRIKGYPHSIWFRPDSSDLQVFYHVFIYEQYSVFDDVPPPNLIVDCGAYVGYSTLWFLNRFPNARVVAIEPDSENMELCKRNLESYGDRVCLLHAAVWPTQISLFIEERHDPREKWGTFVQTVSDKTSRCLDSVTLNEILERSGKDRIGILKMDIEGAERYVFAEQTEPWLSRVDNIVIELHGAEEAKVFERAMSAYEHVRLNVGETTVCRNMHPIRS